MKTKRVGKIVILLFVALLCFNTSTTFAKDAKNNKKIGTVIKTKATEDVDVKNPDSTIQPNGYYAYNTYEVVPTSSIRTKNCEFVRYLTGSWAKSDGYTWNKSQSASLSFSSSLETEVKDIIKSSLSLSSSYTTSYSVAISIPADETRDSKLAYGSDFNYQDVKVQRTFHHGTCPSCDSHDHIIHDWEYTTYKEPTEDTYLYVVYK